MICSVVFAIFVTATSHVSSADLARLINFPDSTCIEQSVGEQDFFPTVQFITFDTSCPNTGPETQETIIIDPDWRPMRVAVDSVGRVYRLFNLDTVEFNRMVDDHTPAVSSEDVYSYGEFYIKSTYLYLGSRKCFVESLTQLRSINRDNMKGTYWENEIIRMPSNDSLDIEESLDSMFEVFERDSLSDVESLRRAAKFFELDSVYMEESVDSVSSVLTVS